MIIGTTSRLIDTTEFVKIMQHAASAVALIGIEREGQRQGFCTGWLITPELVVVPDFAIPQNFSEASYFCHFFSPEGTPVIFRAVPTNPPSVVTDPEEQKKPLLLKLAGRAPGHVLKLEFQTIKENDQVLIFQYPGGQNKQQMSIGRVLNTSESNFQYSADTTHGSGGAPVINVTGAVIGMHVGSAPQKDEQLYNANEGILLRQLIGDLQKTPEWDDIASFHKLVDTISSPAGEPARAERKPEESLLISAALQWKIDPGTLSEEEQEVLEPLMINPDDEAEWIMEPEERRQIFRRAGDLQKLQAHKVTGGESDPMQAAINQILMGSNQLNELDENVLLYWKQAVQWFAEVIPGLPTPEEIQENLDKRRLRSRLQVITGPDFKGRKDDLEKLHRWFRKPVAGPKMISGIGGVGKSALIAKFVLELSDTNIIFWLDFDRPDLAPDDAISVLRAIGQQAQLQIPGFQLPELVKENWQESAIVLRSSIASSLPESHTPLMILDGFEIAQHAKRYQEIWDVLNIMMQTLPSLHVIVSGRVPVSGLELNGYREDEHIHLKGMDEESAREWLRSTGLTDEALIKHIMTVSGAVPLILKLAADLVKKGGELSDIPSELPRSMIEGYLYKRILDRIVNPELKKIAEDVLVLRTLQPAMLGTIFHDRMPKNVPENVLFDQLKREMSLVNTETEDMLALTSENALLHIRPEVRSTTLFLLEKNNPDRVSTIHHRAIDWYEKKASVHPGEIAELIYHYLSTGNLISAQKCWQASCAHYLGGAEAEIPEQFINAKKWLVEMLQELTTPDNLLVEWEVGALKRIRDAMSRKLYRIIPGIMQEKNKRSSQSPLVVYDAWILWIQGKPAEALRILEESSPVSGPLGKGRSFLAAAIAARMGDIKRADTILKSLEGNCIQTTKELSVELVQIHSARIRLSVDIENEISIYNRLQPLLKKDPGIKHKLQMILSSQDVMVPGLAGWFTDEFALEAQREQPFVPKDTTDAQEFRKCLNSKRGPLIGKIDPLVENTYISPALREQLQELLKDAEDSDALVERIVQMVTSGCKKWHLATQGLYLQHAFALAANKKRPQDTQHSDVTIAALRGQKISYRKDEREYYSIDEYLDAENPGMPSKVLVTGKTIDLIKQLIGMNYLSTAGKSVAEMLDFSQGIEETVLESRLYGLLLNTFDENTRTVLLYLLSPDPLDVLYKSYLKISLDTKSPKF